MIDADAVSHSDSFAVSSHSIGAWLPYLHNLVAIPGALARDRRCARGQLWEKVTVADVALFKRLRKYCEDGMGDDVACHEEDVRVHDSALILVVLANIGGTKGSIV